MSALNWQGHIPAGHRKLQGDEIIKKDAWARLIRSHTAWRSEFRWMGIMGWSEQMPCSVNGDTYHLEMENEDATKWSENISVFNRRSHILPGDRQSTSDEMIRKTPALNWRVYLPSGVGKLGSDEVFRIDIYARLTQSRTAWRSKIEVGRDGQNDCCALHNERKVTYRLEIGK